MLWVHLIRRTADGHKDSKRRKIVPETWLKEDRQKSLEGNNLSIIVNIFIKVVHFVFLVTRFYFYNILTYVITFLTSVSK